MEDWHRECWAYLLRNLGGIDDLKRQPLGLPTSAFFPKIEDTGHDRALAVFMRVKDLMGLSDWKCDLVAQEHSNAQIGEFLVLRSASPAAGTYRGDDEGVLITYDPGILGSPFNLIATFAHELAHYLLHTVAEQPPGADVEPKLEELATELAVAYSGFAVAANAAFDFQQSQDFGRQGWQGGAWGYFERGRLGLRARRVHDARGDDPAPARACLKPHLQENSTRR